MKDQLQDTSNRYEGLLENCNAEGLDSETRYWTAFQMTQRERKVELKRQKDQCADNVAMAERHLKQIERHRKKLNARRKP